MKLVSAVSNVAIAATLVLTQACGSNTPSESSKKELIAPQICVSCFWETQCGEISPAEIVSHRIQNGDVGIFTEFHCDNGATKLGVHWSDRPCWEASGIRIGQADSLPAGLEKFKSIVENLSCKFGFVVE